MSSSTFLWAPLTNLESLFPIYTNFKIAAPNGHARFMAKPVSCAELPTVGGYITDTMLLKASHETNCFNLL